MFGFDRISKPARVALLAGGLLVAGGVAPVMPTVSAGPGLPGCPSTTDVIEGFSKGLGYLVEDGALNRGEARDARSQFSGWARDEKGLGCAIRNGMMENGGELLAFLGLTPAEMKAAYEDGMSLSEMAEANGNSEADLLALLNGMVDEGLDAFVAAGAFNDTVRDAIDAKAEEHIAWGVDYHKGDPVPEGHGSK